ncbi:MAG: DNA-binding transcriptional regulator [Verrucomicrobiota bacterium]
MQEVNHRVAIVMDSSRAYERGLITGILKYSRLHGPMHFWRKRGILSGGQELITLKQLKNWKPDGIIWREGYKDISLKSLRVPGVVVPFTRPKKNQVNVVADDESIGRKAAKYLLRRGFKHFGYYGYGDRCFFSRDRQRGFVSEVKAHGFSVSLCDRGDRDVISDWLGSSATPLGLMVCTDDLAIDCYEAINQLGYSIPQDCSIIGVGNDELVCDFVSPSLSSIELRTPLAGYEAADALVRLIEGQKYENRIVCQVGEVVERQSTSMLAVEDPFVARAIEYIQSHVSKNIHASDVVKAVPVSRRSLYSRFQQVMGSSIFEEIRRAKMAYAARMLLETDLSVSEIADKLGYSEPKNLARIFRQEKGMAPHRYRQRYMAESLR